MAKDVVTNGREHSVGRDQKRQDVESVLQTALDGPIEEQVVRANVTVDAKSFVRLMLIDTTLS